MAFRSGPRRPLPTHASDFATSTSGHAGRERAQGERRAGQGVPADDERLALADAVRVPPDGDLDGVREQVGGALDQAEDAGRRLDCGIPSSSRNAGRMAVAIS